MYPRKWVKEWVQQSGHLTDLNLALKIGKAFFLLFLGCLIVDVHRCGYISMPHDFLDNLEVGFILTESSTEGMAKIVSTEMRQQLRLAILFLCFLGFYLVVLPANPFNCPVDCMGIQAFTI